MAVSARNVPGTYAFALNAGSSFLQPGECLKNTQGEACTASVPSKPVVGSEKDCRPAPAEVAAREACNLSQFSLRRRSPSLSSSVVSVNNACSASKRLAPVEPAAGFAKAEKLR